MHISKSLKSFLVISLAWHIICFSSAEFTFGNKPSNYHYANVTFLGPILESLDFLHYSLKTNVSNKKAANLDTIPMQIKDNRKIYFNFNRVSKPGIVVALAKEEISFDTSSQDNQFFLSVNREEKQYILYQPSLPKFLLWFSERPPADIELSFTVSPIGKPVFVERTVSTGSLEADLLAMHYLKHWIFFQPSISKAKITSQKIRLNLK